MRAFVQGKETFMFFGKRMVDIYHDLMKDYIMPAIRRWTVRPETAMMRNFYAGLWAMKAAFIFLIFSSRPLMPRKPGWKRRDFKNRPGFIWIPMRTWTGM